MINPWPGEDIRLIRNGKVVEAPVGERLIFKTASGDRLEFTHGHVLYLAVFYFTAHEECTAGPQPTKTCRHQ